MYPEHFAEAEQEEYRRYRLRGGSKRFRPSDVGDEAIYRTLDLPLSNATTDGCYLDDHEHLSPTVDSLTSWEYRQSIRKWFNHLDPPPTTLGELEQLWLLNRSHARGQRGASVQDSTPTDSLIAPPTPPAQQQPTYAITHPHSRERSTQTPHARVVDKGTQTQQPTGKPTCTCHTGSTHCQCQRS